MRLLGLSAGALIVPLCIASSVLADFKWGDNFTLGASELWRNEQGGWFANNGRYDATTPSNFPNAHSSLPFHLVQTDISVDLLNIQDGGIWVRSSDSSGPVGRSGILLVTGGDLQTGTTLYWHVVPPGQGYGSQLAASVPFISSGQTDATIRVTANGDTFSAYINGSTTPATTMTVSGFSSGEVALYDFSPKQSVDGVRVSSTTVIPGDANVDGQVNFLDLLILARYYNTLGGAEWLRGDFDDDGKVSFNDLLLLAKHYGSGAATRAVSVAARRNSSASAPNTSE